LVLGRIVHKVGYLAAFVSNAREAITAIGAAVPDIIFTDIYMPEADGFALINWLRRRTGSIPLVAMSGANKTLTGQLGLAAELGAHATVSKPLLERDVLEAIKLAVRKDDLPWPGRRWS
jgi:CheY-like chemotaxis protein